MTNIPHSQLWGRLQAVFGIDGLSALVKQGESIRNDLTSYGVLTIEFTPKGTAKISVTKGEGIVSLPVMQEVSPSLERK